jgi:hypothetical protein
MSDAQHPGRTGPTDPVVDGDATARENELTAGELTDVLRRSGHGVLALADADRPYAVPMSFGYDGEAVYLQVGDPDDGEKADFLRPGATARLVVSEMRDGTAWHSVVVTGTVDVVDDEDRPDAMAALADNASFPVNAFGGADPEFELFCLDVTDVAGRGGPGYDGEDADSDGRHPAPGGRRRPRSDP